MKRAVLLCCALMGCLPAFSQEELTLEVLLSLSEANNPSLVNAHYSVLGAQAQRREARWEYFPKASVSGFGYQAIRPLIKITPRDVLGNSDQAHVLDEQMTAAAQEYGIKPYYSGFKYGYGAGLTAIQPLYAGGRILSGNKLAELGVQSAEIQERMTRRAVRDSVESKYWQIVALQEKQRTLEQASVLLDELEKELRSAVEAGVATETDLLRLQLRQRELQAGKYRLDGSIGLLKMDLFDQVGYSYRYIDLPSIRLSDTLDELAAPEYWMDEEAEAGRSDESRLLQMRVDAGKLEKQMAAGELRPQVAVGAGYGYSGFQQAAKGKFNGWVGATVQIPLTDIGKAVERSRRYEYQIRQAETDRDYLESRLELQIKMLRLEMETAWKELEVARDAAAIAERTFVQMQHAFEAGRCTSGDLLQAEWEQISAQEELIKCKIAYKTAINSYLCTINSHQS